MRRGSDFHRGNPSGPCKRLYIIAVALVFGVITLAMLKPNIDGLYHETPDRVQYERIAFNIIHHGEFHYHPHLSEQRATGKLKPYMWRELGFPLYLAAIYATVPGYSALSWECLRSSECEEAVPARRREQWVTAIVGAVTVVLVFISAQVFTGSLLLGAAAGLLSLILLPGPGAGGGEPLAALFLLGHATLAAAVWRKPRVVTAVASGVALGLLVLTKAIFQYWLLVLAVVCLVGMWRDARRRHSLMRAFVAMLLVACCVSVPWMVRNAVQAGHFGISLRGGEILSIRAEYGRMTWSEVRGAFAYWLPRGDLRAWAMRRLEPEVHGYARFDRENPEGFYRRFYLRAKKCTGEVATRTGLPEPCVGQRGSAEANFGLTRAALSFMREDWLKHAVLTLAFAQRGCNFSCENFRNAITAYGGMEEWTKPLHWMCSLAKISPYLLLPVLGLLSVLAWKRRNGMLVFLILPVLYGFGLHAAATHFIPRYGQVFAPLFAVILALTVREILRRPRNPAP